MPQILGIIVSYNPTEDLLNNIYSTLNQVSKVIVIDNGSDPSVKKILSQLDTERVEFIFNSSNRGVAAGFNQGIIWGLQNDYKWFLLLDQDSRVTDGMVPELVRISELQPDLRKVIVGPRHEDFYRKIPIDTQGDVQEIPLLISSGTLLSRQVVEHTGMYDENLFIDHVDHDYCLRLRQKGGRCLRVNTATLLHKFGEAKINTFLGKTFFLQSYPPTRRYYMMRNRIVLYKRYGMFREPWFWMDLRSAAKDLAKLVLFESKRRAKLAALTQGLYEGLRWKD